MVGSEGEQVRSRKKGCCDIKIEIEPTVEGLVIKVNSEEGKNIGSVEMNSSICTELYMQQFL
jgi:hypothetical protein